MSGYRYQWLFAGIAFVILACVFFSATLFISISPFACSEDITAHIGELPSKDLAFRTSIQRLAAEIQRCPEVQTYRIIWTVENDPMRQATLYYRKSNRIGYEQDAFSGFADKTYVVDYKAIQAVAERSGALEDFAEYDQSRR